MEESGRRSSKLALRPGGSEEVKYEVWIYLEKLLESLFSWYDNIVDLEEGEKWLMCLGVIKQFVFSRGRQLLAPVSGISEASKIKTSINVQDNMSNSLHYKNNVFFVSIGLLPSW